jgi:hypothetical protein
MFVPPLILYSILLYSILFYSILLYSILFYSIPFSGMNAVSKKNENCRQEIRLTGGS